MTFRVEITPQAEEDATNILDWLLAQHAGDTGLRWFQRMNGAVASLAESPKRCPIAPENRLFPFEVRHLLYGQKPHTYRVLFTIENDVVYILHIRHGRRLPLTS
ncbi:Death on curing protein, Doc toxin (plasmid) [Acidisarcina polymorpha]|uniref:Death on curing protein, Doc toxin n=1 Tax=Acidisarcina polymorpha TaxID=2211140 RepID=A0A2Z5GC24_9BACT|nr:type II toxin-antitoxin system RelE/ParE family toxin [Acidisarcina polymorpha]AXC16155.1 Death on curing protein, Doc toxin [Acidisarcina polymorpha]